MSGVAWKPTLDKLTRSKKAAFTHSSQPPAGLFFLYFSSLELMILQASNTAIPETESLETGNSVKHVITIEV